jgi:hypothetical protein
MSLYSSYYYTFEYITYEFKEGRAWIKGRCQRSCNFITMKRKKLGEIVN